MSGGQHHLHPHHVQHGQHVTAQQPFSNHHDVSDLHDAPAHVMDASQFPGFSYSFSSLPDQSHAMVMPTNLSPSLGYNDDSAAHYSHQQQHAQHRESLSSSHTAISGTMTPSAVPIAPPPAFRATSETHRSSPGTSDESTQDRNSPPANSFEEPTAEDFGLANSGHGDGCDLGGKVKDEKPEAAPAWSDLKTKAGKDRKRLPLACIACRRKKIRCSGEKPACKHCLRSRIPCVYKVTARKAAPRTDYMAMLDKRLKRMEERIIKIVPKADHDTSPAVVRAVVKPTLPGSGPPPSKPVTARKRGFDDAFASDLETWAKDSSKRKSSDGSAAGKAGSAEVQQDEENRLFLEGLEALPSKDVQGHLAEVFFDNVYGQAYHLLHKPSYMRKLRNNALPPVLVLSVCAVAARFTPNPKISPSQRQFLRGEEWASHARDICTRRYEWPNITILTCLLILGLHEFGTCHGGRSWALGGQAIRMAFALQLHRDLDYDPLCAGTRTTLSFVDREIRRRIMWACFLMDRFNSSGSDRPMFIKEQSIKIPLPVEERFFQLDMPVQAENLDGSVSRSANDDNEFQRDHAQVKMGVAAYTIRSIAIWGRIVSYLNQGGKEADHHPMWSSESDYSKLVEEIDAFTHSLPQSLQYTPENLDLRISDKSASQYLLLHLSIQQNTLFLGQAAVTFANTRAGMEAPTDFVSRVSAKTFTAANKISDIIRDSEQSQCCISAPFAGYCAFSSTALHIMSIFSGRPAMKASAEMNAGINIRFLRKMMRYWGMFQWMVENIRSQYRNALNTSQSGRMNGEGSPASLIQYGDWFNKFPHGVSDPDLLEITMKKKKEKGEDAVLEQKPELQSVEEFFTTLSPSQNTESKGAQRPLLTKRKSMGKNSSDGAVPTRASISELPRVDSAAAHTPGGRRPSVHEDGAVRQQPPILQQSPTKKQKQQQQQQQQEQQQQQQQQPPRRISASLGGQTNGRAGMSPFGAPQSQPQPFTSMSPLSPTSLNPFATQQLHQQAPPPSQPQQQPLGQHPFFSADMLSMNVPHHSQHPNGFVRPLGRQLSLGGFSADSPNSSGMPDVQQHPRASLPLTPGSMSNFGGQDPSWFLPLNMDGSEVNQQLGFPGNAVDPFANMFGMAPSQIHGLQHPL
ncbi:hypothetical protein HIM_03369 [Hirsutella minnesotensis 3608]|uniref:Zn(2)-C6 fungal-type domain-containing protein n=1 Tax=Hirsutella minnesotensis 3608 TaxID=1043627 RepID=A0A0F7ZVR0_9HYPO|nr:hypothetical protein HIM_03369 [Hirsutella minnesotensis 3608]